MQHRYCVALLAFIFHNIYDANAVSTQLWFETKATPEPPRDMGGLPSDIIGEIYNILDGESFGIGPMHEFVYGWQAIVNTMSMKNNVEARKRAGLQRFALAGINGLTIINHIGVAEIMMNATRTYCFGLGVANPPGSKNLICRGTMYQEGRFSCKVPYLRYPSDRGYLYCIDFFATVKTLDGTQKTADCVRGVIVPKFHYDYICERKEVKIKKMNLSDPIQAYNVRSPVVRRAQSYRAPFDILKLCPDWYGCNIRIAKEDLQHEQLLAVLGLLESNQTAFVGHGGKYWLALYYAQLSTYASYFQGHADLYPWESHGPAVVNANGGIWEQLLKANIGPDMDLHYNLNGIYNRYPNPGIFPDLTKNEEQVQPLNFISLNRDTGSEYGANSRGGREHTNYIDAANYLHGSKTRRSESIKNIV